MSADRSLFFKSWLPIIFLSGILGLTFFNRRHPTWVRILYRVFILTLLFVVVILQVPVIRYWTGLQANKVDASLQMIKINIAWLNYFLDFGVTAFKNQKINHVIDQLIQLSLTLDDGVWRRLSLRQIFRIAINLSVVVLFQVLSVPLSPPEIRTPYSSTMYIFIDSITNTMVIQYVEGVMLLREYYKNFNKRIVALGAELKRKNRRIKFKAENEIVQFRILHESLHEICQEWNEAYQLQLLMIMTKCFIESTTIFAQLIELVPLETSVLQYVFTLAALANSFTLFFQICHSCHITVNQSKKADFLISCLGLCTDDEEIQNEVRMFTVQALEMKLNFKVFGFFSLNLGLVFKFCSTLASYIVIISSFRSFR